MYMDIERERERRKGREHNASTPAPYFKVYSNISWSCKIFK